MSSGAHPLTAVERMRASGLSPFAWANSSVQTRTKAAPSVSGEEVPAVTEPEASNAGFNPARVSASVPGRMQPSSDTKPASVSIPTISSAKLPASRAPLARAWLATAKASCVTRSIPYFTARFSAVIPIEVKASGATSDMRGFGIGLNPVIGIRVIDSIPPAMNASPAPIAIRPAAS